MPFTQVHLGKFDSLLQAGRYADLYLLAAEILRGSSDANEQALRKFCLAAAEINAGKGGFFNVLVREYTARQLQLRIGSAPSGEELKDALQDASNAVAIKLFNDIILRGAGNPVPTAEDIADHDAGEAVASFFAAYLDPGFMVPAFFFWLFLALSPARLINKHVWNGSRAYCLVAIPLGVSGSVQWR